MSRKPKRDIYKKRTEPGFDITRDVDLADLRYLMTTDLLAADEYDRYGLYVDNIIKILLTGSHFIGYSETVKEDLRGRALPDMLLARMKFNAVKYPAQTAPFSYLFRIGFNAFSHYLKEYYKARQNNIVAMSELPEAVQEELSAYSTDWDAIADSLRD